MIDITKLKSDALRATQGEWRLDYGVTRLDIFAEGGPLVATVPWPSEARAIRNATHIANNSPSTTLAFVAVVEAAARHVRAHEAPLNGFDGTEHAKKVVDSYVALREALKPFKAEGED